MKKLFVLLLAVLILGSLALVAVACGGDETTTTAEEATTTTTVEEATTTTVAAIPYNEVADLVGQKGVTFTGPVLSVSAKPDKYLVKLGVTSDSFPCVVYFTDEDKFGGKAGLEALVGKTVVITGDITLNPFGEASECVLTDPSQLAVK